MLRRDLKVNIGFLDGCVFEEGNAHTAGWNPKGSRAFHHEPPGYF